MKIKVEKSFGSDIVYPDAGCDDCRWTGSNGWEARKHCKETGHTAWIHQTKVVNYTPKSL